MACSPHTRHRPTGPPITRRFGLPQRRTIALAFLTSPYSRTASHGTGEGLRPYQHPPGAPIGNLKSAFADDGTSSYARRSPPELDWPLSGAHRNSTVPRDPRGPLQVRRSFFLNLQHCSSFQICFWMLRRVLKV